MNAARGESLFLQEDFTFLIIEFCSSSSSRHASFSESRLSLFVIEMQMANKLSPGPTRKTPSFFASKKHTRHHFGCARVLIKRKSKKQPEPNSFLHTPRINVYEQREILISGRRRHLHSNARIFQRPKLF